VRDEEGNVIDIIIDQEPEHEVQPEGETGMEVEDEEEGGDRRVEGKTDVVRCELRTPLLVPRHITFFLFLFTYTLVYPPHPEGPGHPLSLLKPKS
jgi:hypothetical protein